MNMQFQTKANNNFKIIDPNAVNCTHVNVYLLFYSFGNYYAIWQ
jgi:hypothetical protein